MFKFVERYQQRLAAREAERQKQAEIDRVANQLREDLRSFVSAHSNIKYNVQLRGTRKVAIYHNADGVEFEIDNEFENTEEKRNKVIDHFLDWMESRRAISL